MTINIFRSYNRIKFKNNKFNELFKLKGIIYQTTCVNTPEQNGVSERKNRHLLEVTRALLFQNNVPKVFWSDAILSATYLINKLSSIKLNNKSPLEILYQWTINIEHLRLFGCVTFIKIKWKSKLDFISTKIIFLGYSSITKGYKYFDPINKKVFNSRDVNFFENEPYFKKKNQDSYTIDHNSMVLPQPPNVATNRKIIGNLEDNLEGNLFESDGLDHSDENEPQVEVIRSTRALQPSTRLQDYVTYSVKYPIENYISYENISC
jgi:hypothetical protein